MIVDDVYVIVGSANINERSMAGDKDSEICVGAYQPTFDVHNPIGRVHQFRMSLWAEHLGISGPEFVNPNNCLDKIRALAKKNWDLYAQEKVTDMSSHLLRYPIKVAADGTVTADPTNFPDTGASVLGAEAFLMPDKLTM